MTYDIEPIGDSCRLTITHDRLRERPQLGVVESAEVAATVGITDRHVLTILPIVYRLRSDAR